MIPDVITFMRSLMVIACAEGAVRYAVWWRKVAKTPEPGSRTLEPLMASTSLMHAGLLFIFGYRLMALPLGPIDVATSAPLLMGDAMVCVGAIMALIPCWQITCGFSHEQIWRGIVGRILIAAAGALAIAFRG